MLGLQGLTSDKFSNRFPQPLYPLTWILTDSVAPGGLYKLDPLLFQKGRGVWPLGAWAGPGILPGISGLAPPVSCPSFIWDCQVPPCCPSGAHSRPLPTPFSLGSTIPSSPSSSGHPLHTPFQSHQALLDSFSPPIHASSHPSALPSPTFFSSCSHEPDPPPSFQNTSPIALTFSHRDKDSQTQK